MSGFVPRHSSENLGHETDVGEARECKAQADQRGEEEPAVIEKKCECDFLAGLKAPRRQAYAREMGVCDRKYRNQSGTMYLSAAAFCRAEVARRYSQKALAQASRSKAR